jgi:hypothetical protein
METASQPSHQKESAEALPFVLGSPPSRIAPVKEKLSGRVNPPWAEWFMGWPMGWTGSQPLETGKFQQWFASHGDSSSLK